MKYHITKDGQKIKIKDLSDDHLNNIITYIERIAKEGVTVAVVSGYCVEDYDYDEFHLVDEDVKEEMNYKVYKKERKRRRVRRHSGMMTTEEFWQDY